MYAIRSYYAGEGFAQQELGGLVAMDLPLGGQAEAEGDGSGIEEGDAGLEPEGHGDAVGALQVGVVQRGGDADQLALQQIGVVERAQVVVAGVDLVGTLAGEHSYNFV